MYKYIYLFCAVTVSGFKSVIMEPISKRFRTYTGIEIDFQNLSPEVFTIEDIAKGLSVISRFAGQAKGLISVAEHSINVAKLVPPHLKLEALLHDASEAYLMDIAKPIKQLLPDYARLENEVMRNIAIKFKLSFPFDELIKKADNQVALLEWNNSVLSNKSALFPADIIKNRFLDLFKSIQFNRSLVPSDKVHLRR